MPLPLERLQFTEHLNGKFGTNRAPSFITKQISATNDLEAIYSWLAEFENSPQTWRSYRKEAERLLLWALLEQKKPLSSLTRDDLRTYQNFLADPKPYDRWCGPRQLRHALNWRPFEGPLSRSSMAHATTVINALFSYLVEAGYLAGNPLGLMRRKTQLQDRQPTIERFLEQPLWRAVLDYIETLPRNTIRQQKEYERIHFLFHLLYLMGPRVSEVAGAQMSSIKQQRNNWWWQVTGKGQKTQLIPVNPSMLNALIRYRKFYRLEDLPQPDENCPLFMNLNGTKQVSANMIYRLVKKIFLACATTFKTTNPSFANKLIKASTHWLRHTAITHQADLGIELRYIKRSARHQSVETTMLYQHAEEDLWHQAMSAHNITKESKE